MILQDAVVTGPACVTTHTAYAITGDGPLIEHARIDAVAKYSIVE